jgi:hypothetical protein
VNVEPERRLAGRVSRWALPALGLAFATGAIAGGQDAGWSAAIGVGVVFANLNAYAWSLAWAARISPIALFAVGMGGYVVRLALIVILMALLGRLRWFSPLAFALAVVPSTVFVLVYELRVLAGRFTSELWTIPTTKETAAP